MYISEINIKNFRMFENLTLKFNKTLNVFVGPNNSGKTAILDAIKYVLDTNSSEYIIIDRENDFFRKDENTSADSFSIRLEFKDFSEREEGVFLPYLHYKKDEQDKITPYLYLTLTCSKNNENRKGYIRKVWNTGKDGEGKDIESELKELLAITYLKPLRDAETELKSGKTSRLAKILEGYINMKEADFESGNKEIFQKLKEFNNEIEQIIEEQKGKDKKISKTIKEEYLDKITINGNKDIKLHISNKDNKVKYREILNKMNLGYSNSLGKEGLGYQNILFMAAEMLLLENSTNGYATTLIIEEPEAHLHPQLQLKLLQYLKDLDTMQIFISTHSSNISSKVHIENLFLCQDGKVFSLRPDETVLNKEDYIFLEKFLDVTKADMFFAKGLIFVEGLTEQLVLPRIAEKMGKNLTDKGISIINIGNIAFKRYANILKRKNRDEKINVPIAFITDLDIEVYEKKDLEDKEQKIKEERNAKEKDFNSDLHKIFISQYRTFEVDWLNKDFDYIVSKLDAKRELNNIEETYTYIQNNNKKSKLAYSLNDLSIDNVPKYLKDAISFVWDKI